MIERNDNKCSKGFDLLWNIFLFLSVNGSRKRQNKSNLSFDFAIQSWMKSIGKMVFNLLAFGTIVSVSSMAEKVSSIIAKLIYWSGKVRWKLMKTFSLCFITMHFTFSLTLVHPMNCDKGELIEGRNCALLVQKLANRLNIEFWFHFYAFPQ